MSVVLAKPRTKPQSVRREELLRSAERLFIARGAAATSIDDIAAGAEVAKGTFYLYFASKEAMVAALREEFGAVSCARIAAAVERCAAADWQGKLAAWVEAGVDSYLDRLRLHDALFHEAGLHRRRAGKGDNSIVRDLAALLAAGNAAGAWEVEEPHVTAMLLFHALHGAVDQAIAHHTEKQRGDLIRVLRDFFLRAVCVVASVARRKNGCGKSTMEASLRGR
ncbi:MAG TPA: helix-turn-helix domain-containing protein [Stellaceae bacterium]|nr:helix-turn-helix domain-containing protein [Stellaceae bacterium]